jgi:hypothetical protein
MDGQVEMPTKRCSDVTRKIWWALEASEMKAFIGCEMSTSGLPWRLVEVSRRNRCMCLGLRSMVALLAGQRCNATQWIGVVCSKQRDLAPREKEREQEAAHTTDTNLTN